LERLEAVHNSIQCGCESLEDRNRSVCLALECPGREVCKLASTTEQLGNGRSVILLAGAASVCLPPFLDDNGLYNKDKAGTVKHRSNLSPLEKPGMVSTSVEDGLRRSNVASLPFRSFDVSSRGAQSTLQQSNFPASRLESVRHRFGEQGFSNEVVELLLAGIRDNTKSAYQSSWVSWSDWCNRHSLNPMLSELKNFLSYLTFLYSDGKAYSTVNVHRSMLSVTLDPIDGHPIGSHPLVIQLLKGVYNSNPPQPKYKELWDADVVLNHLSNLNNAKLEVGPLGRKLATLLALSTLSRTCELASISLKSISFSPNAVSFSLLVPTKTQKTGALKSLVIKRFSTDTLDPVACMAAYVGLTATLRNERNSDHLFIGSVRPYGPVVATTVSGWIKKQLGEAGIDTSKFTAHSTRGAGGSKAVAAGTPIQAVLSAGGWRAESTFSRFYRRDRPDSMNAPVSDAVLASSVP